MRRIYKNGKKIKYFKVKGKQRETTFEKAKGKLMKKNTKNYNGRAAINYMEITLLSVRDILYNVKTLFVSFNNKRKETKQM